jgi:hypothetical protein
MRKFRIAAKSKQTNHTHKVIIQLSLMIARSNLKIILIVLNSSFFVMDQIQSIFMGCFACGAFHTKEQKKSVLGFSAFQAILGLTDLPKVSFVQVFIAT